MTGGKDKASLEYKLGTKGSLAVVGRGVPLRKSSDDRHEPPVKERVWMGFGTENFPEPPDRKIR